MSVEPAPIRLESVQALRGVAALLVVAVHATGIWRDIGGGAGLAGPWDRGWAGVDLFFVISGFIMVWIATDRPRGAGTAARCLRDRALRIYPLWWLYCGVMAAYFLLSYGIPAAPGAAGTEQPVRHFLASMLLWPTDVLPVLGVGWTLTFELGFYAVFAVLLWLLPPRLRLWGVWAWGAVIVALWVFPPPGAGWSRGWSGVLLGPLSLQFVMGAAVAASLRRWRPSAAGGWAALLLGGGVFAAVVVFGARVEDLAAPGTRTLSLGAAAAGIVAGLVALEQTGRLRVARPMRALGDMSYTLYLGHFIGLLVLARLGFGLGVLPREGAASFVGFALIGTALSVAGAWVAYLMLERPLVRAVRRRTAA